MPGLSFSTSKEPLSGSAVWYRAIKDSSTPSRDGASATHSSWETDSSLCREKSLTGRIIGVPEPSKPLRWANRGSLECRQILLNLRPMFPMPFGVDQGVRMRVVGDELCFNLRGKTSELLLGKQVQPSGVAL